MFQNVNKTCVTLCRIPLLECHVLFERPLPWISVNNCFVHKHFLILFHDKEHLVIDTFNDNIIFPHQS
jgi:hypothetical protein